MSRVKRGVVAHRRHKKILKQAKGYYGARSRVFRVAKQAVTKAGQYAYRDRRQRKRQFRALWITRINAQSRQRPDLQPAHQWPEESRISLDRRAGGSGRSRQAGVCQRRRTGEGSARCLTAPLQRCLYRATTRQ